MNQPLNDHLLFGQIDPALFGLLSGNRASLYAALLPEIAHHLLEEGIEKPRKEAVSFILSFIMERKEAIWDNQEDASLEGKTPEDMARRVLARLIETNWLFERTKGYKRMVDMGYMPRRILEFLEGIGEDRTRSYGDEVSAVLSLLDVARTKPEERGGNIRKAFSATRSFLNHVRSVSADIRVCEDALAKAGTTNDLLIGFVERVVKDRVVRDYETLSTSQNTFRFRHEVATCCRLIAEDESIMSTLVQADMKTGMQQNADASRTAFLAALDGIVVSFSAVDRYLASMHSSVLAITRRLANSVEFRPSSGMSALFGAAARRIALLAPDEHIRAPDLEELPPTSPHALTRSKPKHAERPSATPVADSPPSDARREAFLMASKRFRVMASPVFKDIDAYAKKSIQENALKAQNCPDRNIQDFFLFRALSRDIRNGGRFGVKGNLLHDDARAGNQRWDAPGFRIQEENL